MPSRWLVGIAALFAVTAWAGPDEFNEGVEAFRAGNYPLAATHFEAVERAGRHDARLQFNLGATYLKLHRYADARARFDRIANDPEWGPLAQYNLGLIDEREAHVDAAKSHYRAALAASTSERLKSLASGRLDAMGGGVRSDERAQWFGLMSVTAGHDDNVTLNEDPSILGVTDQADEYADVSAAVSGYLIGTYESGLRLDVAAFGEFYRQLNDFDQGSGSMGLTWSELAGNWYIETGAKGDIQTLGQDVLADGGTFAIRASHPLGSNLRLRLRGEGSWIDGATNYEYLTGWRGRGGAELQALHESGRLSVGYLYEYNNRDNYQTTTEFLDYSPRRNSGYASIEQDLGRSFVVELRADYADSSYPDEDRIVNSNGTTTIDKRDDTSLTLGARLTWKLTRSTNLFADYGYANVDSTIATYSYKQNRVMAGLEVQL